MDRCRYEIHEPKNDRPHVVYLSEPAMAELRRLKEQRVVAPCPFVFSTTDRTSATGVRKAKVSLDEIHNLRTPETANPNPFEP